MGPEFRAFCYRKLIRYIGYFGDIGPNSGLLRAKRFIMKNTSQTCDMKGSESQTRRVA